MKILVDKNSIVTSVIRVGDAEGGIEVEEYPADLAPIKYKYIDGRFEINLDYLAIDFNNAKAQKVIESKVKLAEWLEEHPMQYTDGKYYSVITEKQTLLNNNLTSFERAEQAGIPYSLRWNATGEECTEWEYEDLLVLSLTIAAYVAPKVAAQQALEIEINACETAEQLAEVVIDYDT